MILRYLGIFCLIVNGIIFKMQYNHRGGLYKKDKEKQKIGGSSFRFVYFYLQITTPSFAIIAYLKDSFPFQFFFSPTTFFAGLFFTVIGTWGLIWSKRSLSHNYSPCFDTYFPKDITKKGPYLFVRHPIYSFNILSLLGLSLSTGSLFVLMNTFIMSFYYIQSAYKEEASLKNKFVPYQEYCKQTSMFLPKFWGKYGIIKNKAHHKRSSLQSTEET